MRIQIRQGMIIAAAIAMPTFLILNAVFLHVSLLGWFVLLLVSAVIGVIGYFIIRWLEWLS